MPPAPSSGGGAARYFGLAGDGAWAVGAARGRLPRAVTAR